MPRHLGPDDLPQITVLSSTEPIDPGIILAEDDFTGTPGVSVTSANSVFNASFPSGVMTFENGGFTGTCARTGTASTLYRGIDFPDEPVVMVDCKVKFSTKSMAAPLFTTLFQFYDNVFADMTVAYDYLGRILIGGGSYGTLALQMDVDTWFRLRMIYDSVGNTFAVHVFYDGNIDGTVPDVSRVNEGFSLGPCTLIRVGKFAGSGSLAQISYDDLAIYTEVPTNGDPYPQRSGLQFTGAGISSMVDNPSTRSTDITVANNPSSVELEGHHYWAHNQTLGTGTEFLDFGPYNQNAGHNDTYSWIDEGASDLENGLLVFATEGLYRVIASTYFSINAPPYTYAAKDLFSIMGRVYNPDDSLRYDVNRPAYEVLKYASGQSGWSCRLALTDVMEVGSYMTFLKLGSDQMVSRLVSPWLDVRKVV